MRVNPFVPRFGAMIPISKAHIPTELDEPVNDWSTLLNGASIIAHDINNPETPEARAKAIAQIRKVDPDFNPDKGIMVIHEPDWGMMMGMDPQVGKVFLLTNEDIDRAKKLTGEVLQRDILVEFNKCWDELREQNGMDKVALDVSKAQAEAMHKLKRSKDTHVTTPIMPVFVDPHDDGNYQLVEVLEDDIDLWRQRVLDVVRQVARKANLQGLADALQTKTVEQSADEASPPKD